MNPSGKYDQMDLAEILQYLPSVLRGCWRFRWHAVAASWILCLTGWAMTLSIPDFFQASTRLYVDTQNTLRPLLKGLAVNPDLTGDINLMMRAILSRPSLEKIARATDLDLEIRDQEGFEGLIERLLINIEISKDRNNILRIAYTHSDSQKALAVVTALLNEFIEGALGANRNDAESAQNFLEKKLREYEERLNQAEQHLADFKKENVGMMPGQGGDYFARLQLEMERLGEIEFRLKSARERRDELERQLEGEEPVFGLASAVTGAETPTIDRQISQYEKQLTELRLRFTETHPDIVQINSIIEDLKARKAERADEQVVGGRTTYSPLDLNPVYQQMKIQYSQVEVELADLNAQYSDQQMRVKNLKRKVDTIPDIEAKFKQLTRDHEVTRIQYSQLLVRLESAKLSEDAEESKNDIKFRVLDPPSVPIAPAGPNRVLLATGVLLFGLLAGVGLTVVLNLIRPVFFSATQVEQVFGISVLGVIGIAHTPGAHMRTRLNTLLLTVCLAGLLGIYSLLLVFNKAAVDMAGSLMRVAGL